MAGVLPLTPLLMESNSSNYIASTATNNSSSNSTVVAFRNLVPALVECFTIIFFGYVAGRTRIVCPSQSRGLGHYVTYFALPAMLFRSVVGLEFSQVNWLFWASVLIAKAIVFTAVYAGTLLLSGSGGLGKAGLFGIFATQSNDFALGYPIAKALYSSSNPEIIQYIYIFAPINLLFINPWGFLSLEVQKASRVTERQDKATVVWSIFKGLLCNPIFVTVPIAVICNFALYQQLPSTLDNILASLESSFGATALFLLGINMVGKVKQQTGMALSTPALLIAAKLLVLPLVTNRLVYALDPGRGNDTLTDTYASFGFLYGSLPTAPSVFLYATYYQESVRMLAPTMVYCTFASAPLTFITATMVMIPMATEGQYHAALSEGAFTVSCFGLASAIWVFIIFLLRRKLSHFPHQFTANLIIAQALAAFSVILCHSVHLSSHWARIVHFILLLTGAFGARCWTAMVAVSLFVLRYRSTCFVIRHRFWFFIYGWGVPVMTVGILVAVMPLDESVDTMYEIKNQQVVASLIIVILNLVVTVVSLVGLHRTDRYRLEGYQSLPGQESSDNEGENTVNMNNGVSPQDGSSNNSEDGCSSESQSSASLLMDIEDLATMNDTIQHQMCGTRFGCSGYQAGECRQILLRRNLRELSHQEEDGRMLTEAQKHQLGRHLTLLFLLIISMIVAVSLCLWKLLGTSQSGIFLELSFLDTILNYGQGFMVLVIFGFDTENVIMPVIKMLRRCISGMEKVRLPRRSELSPEVMNTCQQFKTHHLARCQDAIVTDLKYRLRTYGNVFRGTDLIDWLLEVGLAEGRSEASTYATRLLLGRILQHVHQEHHFHDSGYFYRFLQDEDGDLMTSRDRITNNVQS